MKTRRNGKKTLATVGRKLGVLFRRRADKVAALKAVPLFTDLNLKEMNEIARHATEVTMGAGSVLAKQGSYGLEFMYIVEGRARVEQDGKVINRLSRGDFFGEISLLDGGLRTAGVIAETQITLLVVHKQFFDVMLDQVDGLERKIIHALCKYVRSAEQR